MEGSHNQQVRRAQTSLNPEAPSTSYQVNVKRNKTRKWVEAKVQNYDGDDWGADEYDEESDPDHDSSATPPPPINPSLRTFSGTDLLHSRHNTPSPASSLSALPSLRSQVPQPPAVPPASESPRIAVASPDVSDLSVRSNSDSIASPHVVSPQSVQGRDGDGSNLPLAGIAQLPSQVQQQQHQGPSGFNVSRTPSFEQAVKPTSTPPVASDRFVTPPQNPAASPPPADQPPPVIYSPNNYSRLPDENEDHAALALAPTTTAGSDQGAFEPKPLAREDTRDTWERDEEPSSHADQPGVPGISPDVAESQIDRGRMSVSPKLPDLSRMSAFGADLFSSSTSNNFPKERAIDENQGDRGEEPAASPAAVPPVIDYSQTAPPAEGQDHSEVPGGAPLSQSSDLFPGRNIPSIPPLRTPSPHEPRTAVPMFESQGTKITPTEPLQPGREESLADVENPQLFQRMQTYSTSTSSPVKDSPLKENDVLSDEIMRTLSPSGAVAAEVKPFSDGPQLHPAGDRSAVRESSYTLGDYDSYWADAAASLDDASAPPHETLATPQPPQQSAQGQQQGEGKEEPQEPQEPQSSLRRRFSWEDEQRTPTGQPQTPTPLPAPPADDGSSAPALHLTAPSGQPLEPSVTNLTNESRSHSPVSQLSQAPPAGSGVGAPLALQTSVLGHDSSLPEPPSPVSVSVLSDKPSTTAREQSRLSIADEKVLVDQGSVSLETGTPPPAESHPAISSPTSAASVPAPQTPVHNAALPQAKAMNFKDIMALSTPSERIDKYGEARQILAARDSGLDTWLVHMSTEHPELPASKSVPGQTSQSTNNAALPAGAQPSGQQPYHQHSPSTAGPQSGGGGGARSRLGGLSMPSQMSGSALSHSGKEIGNKSKEFMHSAGKMGKGLLSKGKSKLRGSGDKVDTIPPDHPVPQKPHRRSTWRFSLEPRPQDDLAPHTSSVEIIETTPPQLPDPSPISPLNAASGAGSAFPWTVENDMPHQDVSPVKESIDDDERVRLDELVIANSFLPGAYASAEHDEGFFPAGQPGASDVNLDMVTPDDWVVVQHQGEQSQAQRMSLSHRAMATQDIAGPGAAIGSAVGAAAEANAPQHQAWQPPTQTQTQNQPQSGPDTPQRNSSFIGLPPIRRGSTFGPKPKARRATERFSLDDEDDNADGANGWAVAGADGYDGVHPAQRPGGGFDRPAAAPAEALMNTSKTLPPQPMQGVPLPTAVNFSQGQTPNAGRQYQQPQQHQQHQQQSQQQQYPGGPNPQFAQIGPHNVPPGMPAPILSSLVQKPPPTGSWKLEESHLTAPLQVTKKRSGTDIAQQFAYSAYDKELGLEYPAAPMPPAQGPPGRFRSDVPPSSARRYPDLFSLSPAQDPRQQHIRGQGFPPPQIQQGRPPREGAAGPRQQQQQQQGGPESPASGMAADDRGRRRNSGIFRDIGTRLARATSRERRSSVSDVKPRGDEMSEGSVVTEDASDRKRKRASFFGLSGRPISADQAPRHQAGGEVPTDSHEERKRSLFGVAPLKIGPGNFSRSSTANSAFEQAAGPGSEANPHKRRISDIAKVSGIAGLFGRTRQDRSSLGAMPTSQQSDEQRQTSQASIQTPPMQLPSLDFASDPLESMSSLGFEESFQDYRHEEQPAQKHLFNSQLHSAPPDNFINPQARAVSPLSNIVSAQEGAVPAVVAPPTINQSEQGMPQDHPKIHQDVAGGEDLEAPPGLQADSMDEKTPKLQDFIFQEKMAALQLGGLDDNVSEEEISRSQTVSPDISISSNAKAEEHIPERNEILITPPPETSLPALADSDAINHSAVAKDLPPSIHSFPSVSSLREKSDAKSVEQEEGSVHQTKEEEAAISREPSPQIAKSEISSKVATPASEHQQLHSPALAAVNVSETQSAEPPATPQSQVGPLQRPESRALPESQQLPVSQQRPLSQERFESEPRPISQQRLEPQQGPEPQQEPGPQQRPISQQRLESEQRFESQRPEFQQRPTSQQRPMSQQRPPLAPDQRQQFQQFHAQGSVFPVGGNQPVLQQRPQYPPSVSVSNASIASEASTPIYSTQQSRSHNLFPGLPVSPGRALTQPPDGSAQQKENQGSRWKGFRNRVTEQISQKTQPQQQQPQQQQPPPQLQQQQSQGKTLVGEKIKTNKLLGALRRTSKQPEPVQSQSLEPSPSSRQLPHPNPQPHPQGYQPQPGQVQGPRPPANQNQYLQPSMQQPPNLPRAKTMPAGHVQQQVSPPQGQTRSSEPRYESVPIPRGYAAVHGEGRIVPSPYQPNLRQHLPHGQFAPLQPHMQQQQHPHLHPQQHVQRQWQGAHPPPMSYQHHHQPQPQPAQYHGGQQSPPMVQGPVSAPLPHERPLHMRFPSDPRSDYFNSQSSSSLNTQHNRHNSQGSQNSRVGLPRPPSDLGSNLGKSHSASPQQSERENLPVVDGLRSASRSPAVSVGADQKPDLKPDTKSDKTAESTQPSSLGIDIEKAQQLEEDDLYSATPRKIENGVQPTISRTMSNEQAESSAAAATQANVKRSNTVLAELEDTEEARKRAIRLASQEEKIFYEPEDEMPKMSATSYPGQEWNPFGEQEFADWRED